MTRETLGITIMLIGSFIGGVGVTLICIGIKNYYKKIKPF
jgi:hypothetical protein